MKPRAGESGLPRPPVLPGEATATEPLAALRVRRALSAAGARKAPEDRPQLALRRQTASGPRLLRAQAGPGPRM